MKTIAEIRLENLERLISELGTQDRVATLSETSPIYLSQIRNQAADTKTGRIRQIGDELARKLEIGCEKERGWMDHAAALNPKVEAIAKIALQLMAEGQEDALAQLVRIGLTFTEPHPKASDGNERHAA